MRFPGVDGRLKEKLCLSEEQIDQDGDLVAVTSRIFSESLKNNHEAVETSKVTVRRGCVSL